MQDNPEYLACHRCDSIPVVNKSETFVDCPECHASAPVHLWNKICRLVKEKQDRLLLPLLERIRILEEREKK